MKIVGYVSRFDQSADCEGDSYSPEAFDRSIAAVKSGVALPVFAEHNYDLPIGSLTSMAKDARGVWAEANVDEQALGASRLVARAASPEGVGLSLGFITRKAEQTSATTRTIEDAEIHELSLVGVQCVGGARGHVASDQTALKSCCAKCSDTIGDLDTLISEAQKMGYAIALKAEREQALAAAERKSLAAFSQKLERAQEDLADFVGRQHLRNKQ